MCRRCKCPVIDLTCSPLARFSVVVGEKMDVRVALIIYISWVSAMGSCQWWTCQWPLGGQHSYWGTRLAVRLCTHPHPSAVPQPQEEFIYSSFLVCLCLGFCSQRCRITLLFLTLISPSESFQGFGFVLFFYGAMSLLVYFIFPSDYTWIFFFFFFLAVSSLCREMESAAYTANT